MALLYRVNKNNHWAVPAVLGALLVGALYWVNTTGVVVPQQGQGVGNFSSLRGVVGLSQHRQQQTLLNAELQPHTLVENSAGGTKHKGTTTTKTSCPCWAREQLDFTSCQFSIDGGVETTRLVSQGGQDAAMTSETAHEHVVFYAQAKDHRLRQRHDNHEQEDEKANYSCHYYAHHAHNAIWAADSDATPLSVDEYEACAAELVDYCLTESKTHGPSVVTDPHADNHKNKEGAKGPDVDGAVVEEENVSCPCWAADAFASIELSASSCESQLSHPHLNKYRIHYKYECGKNNKNKNKDGDVNVDDKDENNNDNNNTHKPCEAVVRQDTSGDSYCAHTAAAPAPMVHVPHLTDAQMAACYADLWQQCSAFATAAFL